MPSPDAPERVPAAAARLRVQRIRPAYRQVADELRRQIIAGLLPAGHRLPNEPELSRAFGVSRSTVREALRVLASQHLIETLRGGRGGSFVAAPDPPPARLPAERADAETVEAARAAASAPRDPRDPSGFVPHLDFHTTILMAT